MNTYTAYMCKMNGATVVGECRVNLDATSTWHQSTQHRSTHSERLRLDSQENCVCSAILYI
jgi:hypothetical protein